MYNLICFLSVRELQQRKAAVLERIINVLLLFFSSYTESTKYWEKKTISIRSVREYSISGSLSRNNLQAFMWITNCPTDNCSFTRYFTWNENVFDTCKQCF